MAVKLKPRAVGGYKHSEDLFKHAFGAPIGNIFFVDSATGSDTAGFGRSPDAPFATLAYAFSSDVLTANNDDHVFIAPGHTETVDAAGDIAMDIAGVTVIGLGNNNASPLFTFATDTAATIAISANGITLRNVRVKTTIDELVTMFAITGENVTIDNVTYVDNGSTAQALQFILTTAAADFLTVKNCRHVKTVAATATEVWIALVGCTDCKILDCTFFMVLRDNASACVISADGNTRRTEIGRVKAHVTGYTSGLVSVVIGASGATGIHYDSRYYCDTTIVTTINDCPSMASFEVYCSNDLDKNGILDPTVAS